jgi:hypothetical protein
MNVQLLLLAYNLNGNETLKDIATSHIDTTIKEHLRSDGVLFIHTSWQAWLISNQGALTISSTSTRKRAKSWLANTLRHSM